MLRDVGVVTVTCLQLLLLAGGAQPRPRAWDEDGQQLEAIKHGILRRLGMAGPPPVPHAPDPESISRARRLYERRVAELRGNRSREREERDGAAAATRWHRLTAIRKWTLRSRRVPGPRPPALPPAASCVSSNRVPKLHPAASPSRVPPSPNPHPAGSPNGVPKTRPTVSPSHIPLHLQTVPQPTPCPDTCWDMTGHESTAVTFLLSSSSSSSSSPLLLPPLPTLPSEEEELQFSI